MVEHEFVNAADENIRFPKRDHFTVYSHRIAILVTCENADANRISMRPFFFSPITNYFLFILIEEVSKKSGHSATP